MPGNCASLKPTNWNLAGEARGTFEPALVRAAYGSLGRTCLGVARRAKTEALGNPVQTYQNPRLRGWHNRLLYDLTMQQR